MPARIVSAQRAGVAAALLATGLVAVGPPAVANARNDDNGTTAPSPVLHKYADGTGANQLFMIWGASALFGPDISDGTNGGYSANVPLVMKYDVGVQPQGIGYAMPPPLLQEPPAPPPSPPIVMPGGQTAAPPGGQSAYPAEAPQHIIPVGAP